MADRGGAPVILYKRWRLHDGTDVEQVRTLVSESIVPMYRALSADVVLGLELCSDRRSVLAIQRWRSRTRLERAMSGPAFPRWWSGYQPILAKWDALLVLESEWETDELLI